MSARRDDPSGDHGEEGKKQRVFAWACCQTKRGGHNAFEEESQECDIVWAEILRKKKCVRTCKGFRIITLRIWKT
jgi:hypothetical protein